MKTEKIREIKLGDKVYYYPNKKESASCNFSNVIVGDVVKVLDRELLNIKLRCDGGKDLTKRGVSRKTVGKEEEVWDYID